MNSQDIQNLQESYLAVYDDETRENLEFENWVNNLLDEGYDLSSYNLDELYETYIGEERAPGVSEYKPNRRNPLPAAKPLSGKKGDGSGYGKPSPDGKDPLNTNQADYNKFAKRLPPTTRRYGRPFGRYAPGKIILNDILKKLPPEEKKKPSREIVRKKTNEAYDLYDIILSHLIDEGYADTFESAEAIMVNMSEDWRQSIVEDFPNVQNKPRPGDAGTSGLKMIQTPGGQRGYINKHSGGEILPLGTVNKIMGGNLMVKNKNPKSNIQTA